MKPRKKWQPDYRFGGNPADPIKPAPLGTKVPWRTMKAKKGKRK